MLRRFGVFFQLVCMIVFVCVFIGDAITLAESLQSQNYILNESAIGTNEMQDSSSTSFQGSSSTGFFAIGDASSSNYQIGTGTKTTNDPTLSFSVNTANVIFNSFTPTAATVSTATFSVKNYTSYGYAVQISGDPPSNNGHTLPAMDIVGSSEAGTEQFGINLVANTSPSSVGANPDNGQFGFGSVTADYSTPNQFKYTDGDIIALAPKSSGETNYTITYLINVNPTTPGGQYVSSQTLIVTGTY